MAVCAIAICRGVLLNLLLDFEFKIMRHYVAIRSRFQTQFPSFVTHFLAAFVVCDCNPINIIWNFRFSSQDLLVFQVKILIELNRKSRSVNYLAHLINFESPRKKRNENVSN